MHQMFYGCCKNCRFMKAKATATKALLKEMGGEMKQVFLTMGEYDLIFIYEAVDDATAARFTLSLGMLGNVRTRAC